MAFQVDMDLTGSPFNDSSGGGGSGIWHLSEQPGGFASDSYYQPFIQQLPRFSEGGFDNGWLAPSYGSLVISNRPTDPDHPFSGTNLGILIDNPMSVVPTTLYWDGQKIGQVSSILKDLTENSLSFQLEAPVQSYNLLRLFLAETSTTAEVIGIADNGAGKCRITFSASHPFSTGEVVFFVGMDLVGAELESDGSSSTLFTITDVPAGTTIDLEKDFADIAFPNPITENKSISGGTVYAVDTLIDNAIQVDSPVTIDSGVTVTLTGTLTITAVERRLPEDVDIPAGLTLTIDDGLTVAVSGVSSAAGQVYYDVGSATSSDNQLAFAFGTITLENPILVLNIAKTRVGNPNLMIELAGGNDAKVQDDGQQESVDVSESTDFTTVEAGSFPMLVLASGAVNGEASVTGTTGYVDRTNGDSTASDFFVMLGQTLGYDVVQTLAPDSDTETAELAIFETQQQRFIDFADIVARGINYQFWIDEPEKTIHVIDRANSPASSLTIYPEDIVGINLGLPGPISGLMSTRPFNQALGAGTLANAYKLHRFQRFVRLAIADTGRDQRIRTFAPSMTKATRMLGNIRTITTRPRIEITILGINTAIGLGERIDFFSDSIGISGYFITRKRSWNFAQEQTTWGGDAVIDPYTQAGSA
jgi:hypothetical protein